MLSVSQGDGLCPLSASDSLYQPLPYPGIPALSQQTTLPSAENGRFVCSEELPIHLGPCQSLSSTQLFSLIFYLHPPLPPLFSCLSAQVSLHQPHRVPSKAPRFPLNWCRLPPLEHPSMQHLNCNYFVNSRRVGAIYWPGLCPEGFHRDWHSMSLL